MDCKDMNTLELINFLESKEVRQDICDSLRDNCIDGARLVCLLEDQTEFVTVFPKSGHRLLLKRAVNSMKTEMKTTKDYSRIRRDCPICGKKQKYLNKHLKNIHEQTEAQCRKLNSECRTRKPGVTATKVTCPYPGCHQAVVRIDRHLVTVHRLKKGSEDYLRLNTKAMKAKAEVRSATATATATGATCTPLSTPGLLDNQSRSGTCNHLFECAPKHCSIYGGETFVLICNTECNHIQAGKNLIVRFADNGDVHLTSEGGTCLVQGEIPESKNRAHSIIGTVLLEDTWQILGSFPFEYTMIKEAKENITLEGESGSGRKRKRENPLLGRAKTTSSNSSVDH